jgi:hypothetical protein
VSRLSPNQMTARKVETLKDGTHSDGGNLWITVAGKSRVWSIRYKSPTTGKRREMGLCPYRDISLAVARDKASAARRLIRDGIDPIEHRKAERAARLQEAGLTFEAVAERYVEEQKAGWRDGRSAPIWTSSLKRLAYPAIGKKAIEGIETEDVLKVLRPLWSTRTETADRLRGRLERILDYAGAATSPISSPSPQRSPRSSTIRPCRGKASRPSWRPSLTLKALARLPSASPA